MPALAVGAVFATPPLGIFGPGYSDQAGALRILLAAVQLAALHLLGVRQAVGDAAGFARPHVAVAAATVAAVAVLPADVAASTAWIVLAIQVATVVVLLFTQRTRSVSRRSVLPE